MGPALIIVVWTLGALAVGSIVYHGVVLARVLHSARRHGTVRQGLSIPEPPDGWPAVCLVVPAHNEEAVIGAHVRSVLAQDYPALRVVFALDRCTDRTEAVVREAAAQGAGGLDPRVEIVRIDTQAPGWAGKTHAVWRGMAGARAPASARVLLFADADTIFEPSLVRAGVALMLERRLVMLSLLSGLTRDRWFEKIVQPSAGFELVRQYPLDLVNRERRPRAFANGQFMMFTREVYDRLGGHELVKDHLLEDLAFARHLGHLRHTDDSVRWNVLMPGGLLTCRMYRDWATFRRGWKRIYTEAAVRRPGQLREWALRLVGTGVALPTASVAGLALGAWLWATTDDPAGPALIGLCAGSIAMMLAALGRVYADQRVPLGWVLMAPIGAAWVARLLWESASDLRARRAVVWGGREYVREAQG